MGVRNELFSYISYSQQNGCSLSKKYRIRIHKKYLPINNRMSPYGLKENSFIALIELYLACSLGGDLSDNTYVATVWRVRERYLQNIIVRSHR